jgi:hypothetical protein
MSRQKQHDQQLGGRVLMGTCGMQRCARPPGRRAPRSWLVPNWRMAGG